MYGIKIEHFSVKEAAVGVVVFAIWTNRLVERRTGGRRWEARRGDDEFARGRRERWSWPWLVAYDRDREGERKDEGRRRWWRCWSLVRPIFAEVGCSSFISGWSWGRVRLVWKPLIAAAGVDLGDGTATIADWERERQERRKRVESCAAVCEWENGN